MKIVLALGMQLLTLLAVAWPIVWAIHLIKLATRRLWSSFALSSTLIVPYLAAMGAYAALFAGGHNGPTDWTLHVVLLGSGVTVVALWLLLVVSISRNRSQAK